MKESDTNSAYRRATFICFGCRKPYQYIGDVPDGGWPIGEEPYCTCGTTICEKCGQRVRPK